MSYGIQIYNYNNEMIIDDKYRNFYVYSSGSAVSSSSYTYNGVTYYKYTISYSNSTPPLLFVKIPTNVWHYVDTLSTSGIVLWMSSNIIIDYKIVTVKNTSTAAGNYGLYVKDANNQIAFDNILSQAVLITGGLWSYSGTNTSSSLFANHTSADLTSYSLVTYAMSMYFDYGLSTEEVRLIQRRNSTTQMEFFWTGWNVWYSGDPNMPAATTTWNFSVPLLFIK